jgi:hypothetical protein
LIPVLGYAASFAVRLVLSFGFGIARRYDVIGPASLEVVDDRQRQIQKSVRDGCFEVAVGVFTAVSAVICAKTFGWIFKL